MTQWSRDVSREAFEQFGTLPARDPVGRIVGILADCWARIASQSESDTDMLAESVHGLCRAYQLGSERSNSDELVAGVGGFARWLGLQIGIESKFLP